MCGLMKCWGDVAFEQMIRHELYDLCGLLVRKGMVEIPTRAYRICIEFERVCDGLIWLVLIFI